MLNCSEFLSSPPEPPFKTLLAGPLGRVEVEAIGTLGEEVLDASEETCQFLSSS